MTRTLIADCGLRIAECKKSERRAFSLLQSAIRNPKSAIILLLVLAACSKPPTRKSGAEVSYDPRKDPLVNPKSLLEPPPSDRGQVATDQTLTIALHGSPNTLNPLFLSSLYEQTAASVVYEMLFLFDKDFKWIVNDAFIESYEESPDHTVITARLKPGLKWQDGHPLTAHDVVFTWRQVMDDRVPVQAMRTGPDQITQCTAIDDRTIKYVQSKPMATRLWNIEFWIIPKHLFEKHKNDQPDLKTGPYYNQLARAPIGNGPYKFVEWKDQDRLVLERWEDYPGRKPYFKRLIFRLIPDDHISLLSLEKGDVDCVEQMGPQQFAIESTQSEQFKQNAFKGWYSEWQYRYIGWNMDGSNPFFKDKRVRLAMTHALNLPLVLDKVLYNLNTPCYGVFHPDSWMFNRDIKLLDYDLKKAAALLDEAGWTVDPSDGWRYKQIDGQKASFEFTLLLPQGREFYYTIAGIFQDDLKKVGVRMTTRIMEWSAFLEKVHKHEFQAQMSAWGSGSDPDGEWNLWRSEEYKTGRNFGGYSNPEVDKLLEEGRAEFDQEKRAKIYQRIGKLIYDDQPYTFVCNVPTLAGFNKRIRGVQFSPGGIFLFEPSFYGWWTPRVSNLAAMK